MISAWRSRAVSPFRRLLPILSLAILCICAFAVAGGFSTQITSAIGNEVLVVGNNCAIFNPDALKTANSTGITRWAAYKTQLLSSAANYAQQCYSVSTSSFLGCSTLVRKRLSVQIDRNASCPFKDSICRTADGNLVLDTGYLDSHYDFGLNAPASNRFLFRQVIRCAPLVTEGYKSRYLTKSGDSYTLYHYGDLETMNKTWGATYSYTNQYPDIDDYTIG